MAMCTVIRSIFPLKAAQIKLKITSANLRCYNIIVIAAILNEICIWWAPEDNIAKFVNKYSL